eukprot:TRINITY_DN6218_c0_g2_i1.p1 TRINITY_DN6218_c0_g2~~TRINITY_DN6218_c0_g2_i1.p1  ORF type:complete len:1611 (+),score=399.23 TRINITY_DN6218_c0_g2_i1:100-4932(+)
MQWQAGMKSGKGAMPAARGSAASFGAGDDPPGLAPPTPKVGGKVAPKLPSGLKGEVAKLPSGLKGSPVALAVGKGRLPKGAAVDDDEEPQSGKAKGSGKSKSKAQSAAPVGGQAFEFGPLCESLEAIGHGAHQAEVQRVHGMLMLPALEKFLSFCKVPAMIEKFQNALNTGFGAFDASTQSAIADKLGPLGISIPDGSWEPSKGGKGNRKGKLSSRIRDMRGGRKKGGGDADDGGGKKGGKGRKVAAASAGDESGGKKSGRGRKTKVKEVRVKGKTGANTIEVTWKPPVKKGSDDEDDGDEQDDEMNEDGWNNGEWGEASSKGSGRKSGAVVKEPSPPRSGGPAGRGRGTSLPAWMTSGVGSTSTAVIDSAPSIPEEIKKKQQPEKDLLADIFAERDSPMPVSKTRKLAGNKGGKAAQAKGGGKAGKAEETSKGPAGRGSGTAQPAWMTAGVGNSSTSAIDSAPSIPEQTKKRKPEKDLLAEVFGERDTPDIAEKGKGRKSKSAKGRKEENDADGGSGKGKGKGGKWVFRPKGDDVDMEEDTKPMAKGGSTGKKGGKRERSRSARRQWAEGETADDAAEDDSHFVDELGSSRLGSSAKAPGAKPFVSIANAKAPVGMAANATGKGGPTPPKFPPPGKGLSSKPPAGGKPADGEGKGQAVAPSKGLLGPIVGLKSHSTNSTGSQSQMAWEDDEENAAEASPPQKGKWVAKPNAEQGPAGSLGKALGGKGRFGKAADIDEPTPETAPGKGLLGKPSAIGTGPGSSSFKPGWGKQAADDGHKGKASESPGPAKAFGKGGVSLTQLKGGQKRSGEEGDEDMAEEECEEDTFARGHGGKHSSQGAAQKGAPPPWTPPWTAKTSSGKGDKNREAEMYDESPTAGTKSFGKAGSGKTDVADGKGKSKGGESDMDNESDFSRGMPFGGKDHAKEGSKSKSKGAEGGKHDGWYTSGTSAFGKSGMGNSKATEGKSKGKGAEDDMHDGSHLAGTTSLGKSSMDKGKSTIGNSKGKGAEGGLQDEAYMGMGKGQYTERKGSLPKGKGGEEDMYGTSNPQLSTGKGWGKDRGKGDSDEMAWGKGAGAGSVHSGMFAKGKGVGSSQGRDESLGKAAGGDMQKASHRTMPPPAMPTGADDARGGFANSQQQQFQRPADPAAWNAPPVGTGPSPAPGAATADFSNVTKAKSAPPSNLPVPPKPPQPPQAQGPQPPQRPQVPQPPQRMQVPQHTNQELATATKAKPLAPPMAGPMSSPAHGPDLSNVSKAAPAQPLPGMQAQPLPGMQLPQPPDSQAFGAMTSPSSHSRPQQPAASPPGPKAPPPAALVVAGCNHDQAGPMIRGSYVLTGEENHGRPVYKSVRQVNNLDLMIYYWDARDGPTFQGWYFGHQVGGNQIWAFSQEWQADAPPERSWRAPMDGPVDPTLTVSATQNVAMEPPQQQMLALTQQPHQQQQMQQQHQLPQAQQQLQLQQQQQQQQQQQSQIPQQPQVQQQQLQQQQLQQQQLLQQQQQTQQQQVAIQQQMQQYQHQAQLLTQQLQMPGLLPMQQQTYHAQYQQIQAAYAQLQQKLQQLQLQQTLQAATVAAPAATVSPAAAPAASGLPGATATMQAAGSPFMSWEGMQLQGQ